MPMDSNGMKNAMLQALALDDDIDAITRDIIEDRVDRLAEAIVLYIQSNALVTTTVIGVCPSGGGPLTGGTGTGTVA